MLQRVVAGFILFALAGLVFGYAAPRAWVIVPIFLPIVIGVYTGLSDVFDGTLVVLILVGIVVTIVGIVAGRILLHTLEGGRRTA
ncbi:MAG: hypothetical protein QOE06_1669 [Thermoleophilaceae bacterium]|jgi:hypothetical protein|nr:hypothetical protein [Thermoleophilaceae bacterium]